METVKRPAGPRPSAPRISAVPPAPDDTISPAAPVTPVLAAEPEGTAGTADPFFQAYRLLQIAFVAVPIIAGLDKFGNLLVDWSQYLAPLLGDIIPPRIFMPIVGVVEIVAGIGVALRPRVFAYIVALWLVGIFASAVSSGYYDIALRDAGLALGAVALGRLSVAFDRREAGREV